jgi:hypothetical protein
MCEDERIWMIRIISRSVVKVIMKNGEKNYEE